MNINLKRILLVDDDSSILELLEVVLKKENFINIYKANTGERALEICKSTVIDMIVLDIMLPDIDGFEVCKKIREITMTPILFLSAKTDEIDRIISLEVGGDDYLIKPFSPREVIAHIRATLRRQLYYENKINDEKRYQFGDFLIDFKRAELYKNAQLVKLTNKEYQVLEYLIKNRNITVSKEKLIENVWRSDYDGYDNTVMVHIRHIREKIEVNPGTPQYIKTIKGRGYRFEDTQI